MKAYLLLILIIIISTSCGKDENSESEIYNGFAMAKINEEEFNLKPAMKFFPDHNAYGLTIAYHINENVVRKQLIFAYIAGETSRQLVRALDSNRKDTLQASYSTRLQDGDVLGNIYKVNELDNIEDYIELTEFNESTGEVIGEFQASFYVDTSAIFDLSSPDTITITDGYFETKFFE